MIITIAIILGAVIDILYIFENKREKNRLIAPHIGHSLEQQTVLSHRINDSRHREHRTEHADQ